MADNEQKAHQLIADAEKKLSSGKSFFGALFGGGASKVDEAIECYQRAANLFKMAKKWSEAGKAFCECASLHQKSSARLDAATSFIDAANCFKKSEPNEAVSCLLKAIEIYTDIGRFSIAAKHHQTIAEIYETELADLDRAVQHYEQAADYFKGEESNSSANKCLLKVAQYAAQLENYQKAIKIYEQVASASLDNALLKYSAKEYFFRAVLCHMCVDLLDSQHALQQYENMYPAFQDSRECKLVRALFQHMEEHNVDGFTETVKEFDSISRLDQWFTTMLLRIKKEIAEDPDLR